MINFSNILKPGSLIRMCVFVKYGYDLCIVVTQLYNTMNLRMLIHIPKVVNFYKLLAP